MRINKNSRLESSSGTFVRVMETSTNIFFMNFKDKDVRSNTRMFDRKRNQIGDSVTANALLMDNLANSSYSWISKELISKKVAE
jgi:hypothetical protein